VTGHFNCSDKLVTLIGLFGFTLERERAREREREKQTSPFKFNENDRLIKGTKIPYES
jgi:hypothetical protein